MTAITITTSIKEKPFFTLIKTRKQYKKTNRSLLPVGHVRIFAFTALLSIGAE